MATSQKNRARIGYLASYDAMLNKIADGKLDSYDVVFISDTKECYVISPELKPWAVNSKVYVFSDVDSAVASLNQSSDSYVGQIVSIYTDETYKAYIVNQDDTGFYVTALQDSTDVIDYDSLGNRPIINLTGTVESPVMVEDLEDGIYAIKGQYQISTLLETIYLSANKNLLIVEHADGITYIKKITSNEITNFTITSEEIQISHCVTTTYLEEQGYATTTYVDEKIAALNFITKEEAKTYIEELLASTLDELLDIKLAEREAGNESIDSLF